MEACPPSAVVPAAEVRAAEPGGAGDGGGGGHGPGGRHGREHLGGDPGDAGRAAGRDAAGGGADGAGEADRLLGEVTRERNQANLARQEADQSAAEAKAVVAFVVDDVLGAAAPSKTRGKAITVLEALANADRSLEGKFAKEPRVEASVRQALAKVYQELGEYEKAEGHAAGPSPSARRPSGPSTRPRSRRCTRSAGRIAQLGKHDKYEQGEALYRRMLEICRRTRKDEDELTLGAMNGLAVILGQRAWLDERLTWRPARRRQARRGGDVAAADPGHPAEDEGTGGPRDPHRDEQPGHHAPATWGNLKEAEPFLREVVQADVKYRPDHPGTLISDGGITLSLLLQSLAGIEEAADWAMRSMEAHLRVLKFKHPSTHGRHQVGGRHDRRADQKFEQALGITDRTLEQARREFGSDDLTTMEFLDLRVDVALQAGRPRAGRVGRRGSAGGSSAEARTRGPADAPALASLADDPPPPGSDGRGQDATGAAP